MRYHSVTMNEMLQNGKKLNTFRSLKATVNKKVNVNEKRTSLKKESSLRQETEKNKKKNVFFCKE